MEWRLRFEREIASVVHTYAGKLTTYRDTGHYSGWIQLHVTGLGWQPARVCIVDQAMAEARCRELNESR